MLEEMAKQMPKKKTSISGNRGTRQACIKRPKTRRLRFRSRPPTRHGKQSRPFFGSSLKIVLVDSIYLSCYIFACILHNH